MKTAVVLACVFGRAVKTKIAKVIWGECGRKSVCSCVFGAPRCSPRRSRPAWLQPGKPNSPSQITNLNLSGPRVPPPESIENRAPPADTISGAGEKACTSYHGGRWCPAQGSRRDVGGCNFLNHKTILPVAAVARLPAFPLLVVPIGAPKKAVQARLAAQAVARRCRSAASSLQGSWTCAIHTWYSILVRKTTAMRSRFMDFRICLFASRTRSRSTLPRYGASSHPTSFSLPTTQRSTSEFVNRELTLARLPTLTQPIYCTMKGYRALGIGGSASLNAICSQIKLARSGETHGAMEDAWLSMQIYLWLHGCPHQRRLPDLIPQTPSNFRDCEIRQCFASRRMPTWVVDREEGEPR